MYYQHNRPEDDCQLRELIVPRPRQPTTDSGWSWIAFKQNDTTSYNWRSLSTYFPQCACLLLLSRYLCQVWDDVGWLRWIGSFFYIVTSLMMWLRCDTDVTIIYVGINTISTRIFFRYFGTSQRICEVMVTDRKFTVGGSLKWWFSRAPPFMTPPHETLYLARGLLINRRPPCATWNDHVNKIPRHEPNTTTSYE